MQESTTRLYEAVVEKIGIGKTPTSKQRALLGRIRSEYYHDFLSPLAMPTVQLVADLRQAKLGALCPRVMAGAFDAGQAEAAAWVRSPEGQAAFRDLTTM